MNIGIILIGFLVSIGIEIGLIFLAAKCLEFACDSITGVKEALWAVLFALALIAIVFVGILIIVSAMWLAAWYWKFLTMAVAA